MSRPPKATGPDRANDRSRQDQNLKTDVEIVAETTAARKRYATLQAEFALLGHEVHACANSGYLVTRPGVARHCPDLDGLEHFLHQIERGKRHA